MPQELVVHNWCDPCFAVKELVEGEVIGPIQITTQGGTKPKSLILCEVHRKEFFEPLRELLAQFGVTREAGEKRVHKKKADQIIGEPEPAHIDGEYQCPEPGCPKVGVLSTLKSHAPKHGMTLAQYAYRIGESVDGLKVKWACKEGACRRTPSGFVKPQGLSQHLMRSHGHPSGVDSDKYLL